MHHLTFYSPYSVLSPVTIYLAASIHHVYPIGFPLFAFINPFYSFLPITSCYSAYYSCLYCSLLVFFSAFYNFLNCATFLIKLLFCAPQLLLMYCCYFLIEFDRFLCSKSWSKAAKKTWKSNGQAEGSAFNSSLKLFEWNGIKWQKAQQKHNKSTQK